MILSEFKVLMLFGNQNFFQLRLLVPKASKLFAALVQQNLKLNSKYGIFRCAWAKRFQLQRKTDSVWKVTTNHWYIHASSTQQKRIKNPETPSKNPKI